MLANLFGTPQRVALGMGEEGDWKTTLREIGKLLAYLKEPEPPRGLKDAWDKWPVLKQVLNMAPKIVSSAPCQEIVREGKDVTIVSYSIGVGLALEAANTLAGEGIDAEVIDLRTLRPLDREAVLTSLAKTNRLVVAEEGWPTCSIASEIMAICMEEGFDHLDAPVLRVCDEDVPLPYAANLEKAAIIDAARIVEAVRKVCYR